MEFCNELHMSLPLFLHFSTRVCNLVPVASFCFSDSAHSVELDRGDVDAHISLPPLTKNPCLAFADFLVLFIFAPFFFLSSSSPFSSFPFFFCRTRVTVIKKLVAGMISSPLTLSFTLRDILSVCDTHISLLSVSCLHT